MIEVLSLSIDFIKQVAMVFIKCWYAAQYFVFIFASFLSRNKMLHLVNKLHPSFGINN